MKNKPYIPFLLPNNNLIDMQKIIMPLIEANKKIVIYNEKLKNTKVRPQYLLELFSLREAVESTKIEGTQVTMDDMLEYRAQKRNSTNDINEVVNYMDALTQGKELLRTLPICTNLIRSVHKILMSKRARGYNSIIPGDLRTTQNFLGPEGCSIDNATYIPPEPQLVPEYLSNLDKFINNEASLDALIKVALLHSQFETIHPFSDGNGRTGRILIPLYLYNIGLISEPNFFVSESLEKDRYKYYMLLNNTRVTISDKEYYPEKYEHDMQLARENTTDWINFFLGTCIQQADKNIIKIDKINSLYEDIIEKCKTITNSTLLLSVIDVIFQYPVFTANTIKQEIDIASATLNNHLKTLCQNKIIYTDNAVRNRKYYLYELISIIS